MGQPTVATKQQYSDLPPGATLLQDPGTQPAVQATYGDLPPGASVVHDPTQHHSVDYSAGFTGFGNTPASPSKPFSLPGAVGKTALKVGEAVASPSLIGSTNSHPDWSEYQWGVADQLANPQAHPVQQADRKPGLLSRIATSIYGAPRFDYTPRNAQEQAEYNKVLHTVTAKQSFLGNLFDSVKDLSPIDLNAEHWVSDPTEALANSTANTIMLRQGLRMANAPTFGSPAQTAEIVQPLSGYKPWQPPKQLAAGPTTTPPPADTSGSVPFTPPPVAATTRAQRLGLMLPEKASAPIELGPGEVLPPESDSEGLFPAASRMVKGRDGNPRVQFLTSAAATDATPPAPAPGEFNLPNATYLRPDMQSLSQQPPAAPKPDLLQGIREHEFLSKVQDELNLPPGDEPGQSFLNQWMDSHNQQTAGATKGPGLMNRTVTSSIEQANAQGKPTLPPEEPQASPGLIGKAKGRKGGPTSPAQATPAAQMPPVQAEAPQPQIATESNMEELLAESLEQARAKKGPGITGKPQVDNRGQYPDLRAELNKMPPEAQQRAIFMSDKTDLPNRRAFDIAQQKGNAKSVAMSDADGLKALNDKFGYGAGDALLKAKADALREAGVEAYHSQGDEFMYRGDSPEDLKTKLGAANDILKNKVIQVETADGKVLKFKGAQFSSGVGDNLGTAETELKANKAEREATGQRKRGTLGTIKQVK